ncbi:hypothetical protein LZ637_12000, partial [Shewanella algae]|nr:hypothetical protein [Shewanella algae]
RTFPKNVLVEFDPTPTPKGLSAKQIRIPEVYIRQRLLNFFTSKGSIPSMVTPRCVCLFRPVFSKIRPRGANI